MRTALSDIAAPLLVCTLAGPALYRAAAVIARLGAGAGENDSFWLDTDAVARLLRRHLDRLTAIGGKPLPAFRVEGQNCLDTALSSGVGAVLLTGHFPMNPVVHFVMQRIGRSTASIVSSDRGYVERMWGTGEVVPNIPNDERSLLRARGWLRNGGILVAVVGSQQAFAGHVEFVRDGLRIFMYPNLFRLALRIGAPVVFFAARLGARSQKVIDFEVPVVGSHDKTVGDLMQQRSQFLFDHADDRFRVRIQ